MLYERCFVIVVKSPINSALQTHKSKGNKCFFFVVQSTINIEERKIEARFEIFRGTH